MADTPLWQRALNATMFKAQGLGQRFESGLAKVLTYHGIPIPDAVGIREATQEETLKILTDAANRRADKEERQSFGVETMVDIIPFKDGSRVLVDLDKKRVQMAKRAQKAVKGLRQIERREGVLPERMTPARPEPQREVLQVRREDFRIDPKDRNPLDPLFRSR